MLSSVLTSTALKKKPGYRWDTYRVSLPIAFYSQFLVPLSLLKYPVASFPHRHAPLLLKEIILFYAWKPLQGSVSVIISSPLCTASQRASQSESLILQLPPSSWLQLYMSLPIRVTTVYSHPQSIPQCFIADISSIVLQSNSPS